MNLQLSRKFFVELNWLGLSVLVNLSDFGKIGYWILGFGFRPGVFGVS